MIKYNFLTVFFNEYQVAFIHEYLNFILIFLNKSPRNKDLMKIKTCLL